MAGNDAVAAGVPADVRLIGDLYIHGIIDSEAVGEEWKRYSRAFEPLYID
jgi:hypothetical protein